MDGRSRHVVREREDRSCLQGRSAVTVLLLVARQTDLLLPGLDSDGVLRLGDADEREEVVLEREEVEQERVAVPAEACE